MSILGRAAFRVGSSCVIKRTFSVSPINCLFWEKSLKGKYEKKNTESRIALIKDGFKQLKGEFILFGKEVRELWEMDPLVMFKPGYVDRIWSFNLKSAFDKWVTTCDSDHNEGWSTCSLDKSPSGFGLFSGVLNNEVPKDGVIKSAGYCCIRSMRKRKSFKRDSSYDWSPYTHIVIRCRGDGRTYMLSLATSGFYDQTWHDMYNFPLHTRGGPYWQISRVPFSKFFFTSKGRIQDFQKEMPLDNITHVGITLADKINGPFSLEIDFIGVEYDPSHTEKTAYELYKIPKNIAAT